MIYTYSYNEILAPQKTTLPLFQSVTFANIVEGQLEEKQLEVPVNFYAIQALNTGEGTNVVQQAADAWLKYVNQNDGQAGAAAAPLSDVQTLQNEAGETPESEDSTGQNEEAEAAEQNEEAEAAGQEES